WRRRRSGCPTCRSTSTARRRAGWSWSRGRSSTWSSSRGGRVPITIVPARPSASPLLTDEQRRQLDTLDDILVKGEGALRVAVEAGARVGHLLVFLRMSPAVTAFVDGWNPDRPGAPARPRGGGGAHRPRGPGGGGARGGGG